MYSSAAEAASHMQAETVPQDEPTPQQMVMVTDIVIVGLGMLQVVGSREELIRMCMYEGTREALVEVQAFMQDGEHVGVMVDTDHVSAVAREHEERIVPREEMERMLNAARQGHNGGPGILDIGGEA